jgi:hypothetical protein
MTRMGAGFQPATIIPPAGPNVSTFLANNSPAFNPRDTTTATISNGVADARAALVTANGKGPVVLTRGVYRVAADLTLDSGLAVQHRGAMLKPDAGVTVTINGPISAGLFQIFDVSAGGRIAFAMGTAEEIPVEWFGASSANVGAVNTPAIQAAVLASLGMGTLADQSAGVRAPVTISGKYEVDTVYLPRYANVRGRSIFAGISLATNTAQGFVLGRSASESQFLDNIQLRDLRITGDPTKTAQQAIKSTLQATAYITHLNFSNVIIQDIGGGGVDIVGAAASMLLYVAWKDVQIINCGGSYAYHVKLGIFNQAIYHELNVSDNYDGIFFEDPGSGTMLAESHKFIGGNIEGNGRPDTGPNAGVDKVGACGFRSTCYQGQFDFHGTYIEVNGNKAGDTTGANNQVVMKNGGRVRLDGVFIAPGANKANIFKFDGPPPGSALSIFDDAGNDYDAGYTDAQKYTYANAATTRTVGYNDTSNYRATPPRQRLQVFRDRELPTIATGAIGIRAVRRLLDKTSLSQQISVYTGVGTVGLATICKNTISAEITLTYFDGSGMAKLYVTAGGGVQLHTDQRGAFFSAVKDTAAKLNVYHDATAGEFVLQNKTAAAANVAVRFDSAEPHETHVDDGYLETACGF